MTVSAALWITWLILGATYEAWSLRRNRDEWRPLTEYVRAVMAYSALFKGGVILFCVWLTLHFTLGIT